MDACRKLIRLLSLSRHGDIFFHPDAIHLASSKGVTAGGNLTSSCRRLKVEAFGGDLVSSSSHAAVWLLGCLCPLARVFVLRVFFFLPKL